VKDYKEIWDSTLYCVEETDEWGVWQKDFSYPTLEEAIKRIEDVIALIKKEMDVVYETSY